MGQYLANTPAKGVAGFGVAPPVPFFGQIHIGVQASQPRALHSLQDFAAGTQKDDNVVAGLAQSNGKPLRSDLRAADKWGHAGNYDLHGPSRELGASRPS